ncbi:MAG: acetyl-CoA C-acetyltransferase [Firmicutes bacterium]|nr:acetyl-CoA C-acetyltransferase [Bacillota bacterium]
MQEVIIASGARTPFGRFLGSFSEVSGPELGAVAIKGALERAGIKPEQVEEVIMGVVYQAGMRANPARQAAIMAGIPVEAPAITINQQCSSGLRCFEMAAHQIMLGKAEIIIVGGMENMTRVPYLLTKARGGYRMGSDTLHDGLFWDALIDPFFNKHMGITAETLAEQYGITREMQDRFALTSQENARRAQEAGFLAEEIVPVEIKGRKGVEVIDKDEHMNPKATMEGLAKLPSAFKKDGTVTAGNASGINDGAAAAVVMSAAKAAELGITPLATFVDCVSTGVDPSVMGIGPAPAIRKLLKLNGLTLDDIGRFELNEAFAAQSLAVVKELGINGELVNVNGGAIALGHPVGASGTRITLALLNEMRRSGVKYGISSLCAGGGPGIACLFKR